MITRRIINEERTFSFTEDELVELLERTYSEGWEEAEKEFSAQSVMRHTSRNIRNLANQTATGAKTAFTSLTGKATQLSPSQLNTLKTSAEFGARTGKLMNQPLGTKVMNKVAPGSVKAGGNILRDVAKKATSGKVTRISDPYGFGITGIRIQ